MLQRLTLQDFKGHRDSTVALAPFTVLVGQNGTGKTSALQALRYLGQANPSTLQHLFVDTRELDRLVRHSDSVHRFVLEAQGLSAQGPRSLRLEASLEDRPGADQQEEEPATARRWSVDLFLSIASQPTLRVSAQQPPIEKDGSLPQGTGDHRWPELSSNSLLRLDAERIAAPALASVDGLVGASGAGVAAVIANLKLRDEPRLDKIITDLKRIVPQVERVRAVPALAKGRRGRDEAGYELLFDFVGAREVPASGVSEGTLLALALVTILNKPRRPRLLLLDDVGHALHPTAQQRLVAVLRALTEGPDAIQVIATSHSPYIVDAVEPEAVQVFALRADGTVAIRALSEHPEAAALRGSLSAGQLWTLDDEQRWVIAGSP